MGAAYVWRVVAEVLEGVFQHELATELALVQNKCSKEKAVLTSDVRQADHPRRAAERPGRGPTHLHHRDLLRQPQKSWTLRLQSPPKLV